MSKRRKRNMPPWGRDKIERKIMSNGAWTETVTYGKPKLVKTTWMQRDPDGEIRQHERMDLLNGFQTGGCPECRQMPCEHTARLLGWTEK